MRTLSESLAKRIESLTATLTIARRDARAGLRGFAVFLACVAIGVAAISGVGSVSRGFLDGVRQQGRIILGGDVAFSLVHRQATAQELAFLSEHGKVSSVGLLRAMARAGNAPPVLIEIKAVDDKWPSLGSATILPEKPLDRLLAFRNGAFGLVAGPGLAARLGLSVGERIEIGGRTFALRGTLRSEPDSLAGTIALGPRVIMRQSALRATDLLQPGSLVRWVYRLELPQADGKPATSRTVRDLVKEAARQFPSAGWQVRTRTEISPQFSQSVRQLTEFLTLVGLTSLIVGGVGVANAVDSFLERKRMDLATLKAVGATGGQVFGISFAQIAFIAFIAIAIGLLIGALTPFALARFDRLIPFPFTPAVYWLTLLRSAIFGFLISMVFSLGPLGRVHDAPVGVLFRDATAEQPRVFIRARYIALMIAAVITFAGSVLWTAADRRAALVYLGAAFGAFLALRLIAAVVKMAAKRLSRRVATDFRLALGTLHSIGSLTNSVVLSLGLSLSLLVTLTFIDGNLRAEIGTIKPGQTPSLFFLDVPSGKTAQFVQFVTSHAPCAKIKTAPLMRGRIVRLNNVPVEKVKASEEDAWVLQGDRGITFSSRPPEGSRLVEGKWWPAHYNGPPLVSVDANIAKGLALKLGEPITVNVLGRNITARIASLRNVNWRSLGINFIFIFSPNAFAGAPHTTLATASFPEFGSSGSDLQLLRKVAARYPEVTTVRVKDAIDAVNGLLDKVALAIRSASSIALLSSILVVAGALTAAQRRRAYQTIVLKTLGATRGRLLRILMIEFVLLALATAAFAILFGGVIAWVIMTRLMAAPSFLWLWRQPLVVLALSVTGMAALGLFDSFRILGMKPARLLREL